MLVSFDSIPDSARVWIFPSSRALNSEQLEQLDQLVSSFLDTWTAHDQALHASFHCSYDHFLVFTVDESRAGASGCSIDKLHRFVKSCELMFHAQFFDRLKVAIPLDQGVQLQPVSEVEKAIAEGRMTGDQPVFDSTVATMKEFRTGFVKPLRQTWLSRYLHQ